jgi:hypothetical protein
MIRIRPKLAWLAALAIAFSGGQRCFAAYIIVDTGVVTNTLGNKVSAEAQIQFNNDGSINIKLFNKLDPTLLTASNQALSGIEMSVTPPLMSPPATLSSGSGRLINIADGGSYTDVGTSANDDLLPQWQLQTGTNGNLWTLTGGQPSDLIATNPTGTNTYNNNNGFDNFNPYVMYEADFTITNSGLNSSAALNSVTFIFGTALEEFTITVHPPVDTPAPASLVLAFTGVVGLGLARFRRLRNRQLLAA